MIDTSLPEAQSSVAHRQLDRLLASPYFNHGKRYPILLKHIVLKTLEGKTEELRERYIGHTIFGKSADYDTNNDNIVRVTAGEIRKRLALYYQEPGRRTELRIEIPTGTYVAVFHLNEERKEKSAAPLPTELSEGLHLETKGSGKDTPSENHPQTYPSRGVEERHLAPEAAVDSAPGVILGSSRAARWRVRGIAAAVTCAVLLIAWICIANWTKSELDLFWEPIIGSNKPVVVYSGSLWVYSPTPAYVNKMLSLVPPGDRNLPAAEYHLPPLAEGQVLTAKDLKVEAVGTDVQASVNVTTFLAGRHHSFSMRTGPDLPFTDLRGLPTVLIGAVTNFWDLNITRDLPFYFDRTLNIRERGGQGRTWTTMVGENDKITEDYAIISRLVNSKTGRQAISISGNSTCGTEAASEFVTDPDQLRKLGSIPRDALKQKNIEFVLHTTLVSCTPTSMDIVALRYW